MNLRIALAVVTATLLIPATVSAASPTAGCGASKELMLVEDVVKVIDKRPYGSVDLTPIVQGVDRNADGFLCHKKFAPNQGQDKRFGFEGYVISQILDNHANRLPA